jgi:uncharacterized caspase-like protein
MPKTSFLLVTTLFTLCTLVPAPAAAASGQWRALVIGIGDYRNPRITDLRTPVADGRELAAVLTGRYNFKVATLFDGEATWANIDRELRRLVAEAGEQDSVLIYYGGHGDLDEKLDEGWWYPVDTEPGNRQTYLQNSDLRELVKKMAARHVLLVSDSCFAGSLFGDYRSFSPKIGDRYHQRLYTSKSRLGLTSGGKEPVLDGGSAEHSIFAYHLLKFLQSDDRPVFSAGEMFTAIAPVVTNNSPQKPEFLPILYTGHESGEFVFVRTGTDLVSYLTVDEAGAIPAATVSGPDRRLLWMAGGVVLFGLLLALVLVPRMVRRRREKELHQALARRDSEGARQILGKRKVQDKQLAAKADRLAASAHGLVLQGMQRTIAIAPGPRQGLGRGERWMLAVADPHISRKPHGWLQLGADGLSLSADGGEVKVNGAVLAMARLAPGDVVALGPITEVVVEKVVAGMGAMLSVQSGPDQGKQLLLVDAGLPLQWLSGDHLGAGTLSWRENRPWLTVEGGDRHPLPAKSELHSFPLLDGDVLRLGEADLTVKVL